ncbi:hypothetical protein O0I10_000044 [Lichtheimia ornata]|uniref:Homeobox domain-containing protein n=1 Tax=Lichtheimia ornata TaxID=688661 RepID=A0AAD7Y4U8_9FUNG|nr:uncharacterized protein O0I10_000044 [Lichtheimia ornata]KAJ8663771.1 hypothetical protein O0I10_000044 [Lichtheimia ornata]
MSTERYQDNHDSSSIESWSPEIKSRWRFSAEQHQALEEAYQEQRNPSQGEINWLAEELQSPRKTVVTWFQNRRAKERRRRGQRQRQESPHMAQAWVSSSSSSSFETAARATTQLLSTHEDSTSSQVLFPTSTDGQRQPMYNGSFSYYLLPASHHSGPMTQYAAWQSPTFQALYALDDIDLFLDLNDIAYSYQ